MKRYSTSFLIVDWLVLLYVIGSFTFAALENESEAETDPVLSNSSQIAHTQSTAQ